MWRTRGYKRQDAHKEQNGLIFYTAINNEKSMCSEMELFGNWLLKNWLNSVIKISSITAINLQAFVPAAINNGPASVGKTPRGRKQFHFYSSCRTRKLSLVSLRDPS